MSLKEDTRGNSARKQCRKRGYHCRRQPAGCPWRHRLGYWVKLGDVGKTYRPLTEVEMDLARLRRTAEVKMERDRAAYFAKESLPGTRR